MPEVNLDKLPKAIRVADLIALLGEQEATRLIAGVKAQRMAPTERPTLDQIGAVRSVLSNREPGENKAERDKLYAAAGQAFAMFFRQPGMGARRRREVVEAWLEREQEFAVSGEEPAPRPKRTRKPITDPEALERRREALAKARATRKANREAQAAEAVAATA